MIVGGSSPLKAARTKRQQTPPWPGEDAGRKDTSALVIHEDGMDMRSQTSLFRGDFTLGLKLNKCLNSQLDDFDP